MVRTPPALRPLFPHLKPAYTHATGLVSPLTRAWSERRGGLLPTGFVATLDEAAARTGGRSVVARAAEVVTRPELQGLPAAMPLSDRRPAESFGPVSVAELPGARVLGMHRAVIASDGTLVDEVSRYFDTSHGGQHPLFLHPFPQPPLEIDGRLGVLAVRGDWMYYHFLMDVMSRVGVLAQAPDIAAPDRWYVPRGLRFQRELLELFGIAPDQVVDAGEHPHVRAETLVVPGWASETQMNPPWVVGFLRDRLLSAAGVAASTKPTRRLYLTRGPSANNRSVRNEDAVLSVLHPLGFESVDPGTLSIRDQIRTFAAAEAIVAPHGGALANLVFASAPALVVELFPTGSLLPDYWRLASGVPGLRYRYLSAFDARTPRTRQTTIVRDIVVDTDSLARLLQELA